VVGRCRCCRRQHDPEDGSQHSGPARPA
jgi:hypothetical protein